MDRQKMKVKICLVGEGAVGKTCLIRRFIQDQFDDRYISTLGAKVSKKEIKVDGPNGGMDVDMTIWDIMGEKGFRELLKEAYFHGAQGVLAVCDVTRKETLDDLEDRGECRNRVRETSSDDCEASCVALHSRTARRRSNPLYLWQR